MVTVYPVGPWLTIERMFVYAEGVGYRGKVDERDEARRLRALGWTMPDIAAELSVSRSSVSLWTREVPVERGPRRLRPREPNVLERRKATEIADLLEAGRARIGALSERDLLIAGAALYAGEGSKTGQRAAFANTDPAMIALFCRWLRQFFPVDESRLRVSLYLHQGLNLPASQAFWSQVTAIPVGQFTKAYRAVPDAGIRHNKHEHGCVSVRYACTEAHRGVMGLVRALLGSTTIPG